MPCHICKSIYGTKSFREQSERKNSTHVIFIFFAHPWGAKVYGKNGFGANSQTSTSAFVSAPCPSPHIVKVGARAPSPGRMELAPLKIHKHWDENSERVTCLRRLFYALPPCTFSNSRSKLENLYILLNLSNLERRSTYLLCFSFMSLFAFVERNLLLHQQQACMLTSVCIIILWTALHGGYLIKLCNTVKCRRPVWSFVNKWWLIVSPSDW